MLETERNKNRKIYEIQNGRKVMRERKWDDGWERRRKQVMEY